MMIEASGGKASLHTCKATRRLQVSPGGRGSAALRIHRLMTLHWRAQSQHCYAVGRCGPARHCVEAVRQGASRAIGVDNNEVMLQYGKGLAAEAGVQTELLQGSIGSIAGELGLGANFQPHVWALKLAGVACFLGFTACPGLDYVPSWTSLPAARLAFCL